MLLYSGLCHLLTVTGVLTTTCYDLAFAIPPASCILLSIHIDVSTTVY